MNSSGAYAIQGYTIYKDGVQVDSMSYDAGKTGVVTFENAAASGEAVIQAKKSFSGSWPSDGFEFTLTGVS